LPAKIGPQIPDRGPTALPPRQAEFNQVLPGRSQTTAYLNDVPDRVKLPHDLSLLDGLRLPQSTGCPTPLPLHARFRMPKIMNARTEVRSAGRRHGSIRQVAAAVDSYEARPPEPTP